MHASVQNQISAVERLSGRMVHIMNDEEISVTASFNYARHGAPAHILRVNPGRPALDYVIARQAGFPLRLFEVPAEQRFDFAVKDSAANALETEFNTQIPAELVKSFAKGVVQWAMLSLRSTPIGMRIDQEIFRENHALRAEVVSGIHDQQQLNLQALGQSVNGLRSPVRFYGISAAYAIFASRLLDRGDYVVPYEVTGALKIGRTLMGLWDDIPKGSEFDRQLVDAWADALGVRDWYQWIPYEP